MSSNGGSDTSGNRQRNIHRQLRTSYRHLNSIFDLLGHDLAWVDDRALCAQVDAELFHPEQGGASNDARAICGRCPLLEPCLTYALVHKPSGVWGGTGERERRDIRRRRGVA